MIYQKHMHLSCVPVSLRFLVRPGRSTAEAHIQSVRACAVETHFLLLACLLKHSSQNTSLGVEFESNLGHKVIFLLKNDLKKTARKNVPLKSQTGCLLTSPGAP
jgi:hypothetical protein